jgi:hypothetical protein
MYKNLFKAPIGLSLISFLLFACQKDLKENSITTQVQDEARFCSPAMAHPLATGLDISFGSTTGPGGDLFVPDAQTGVIYRIDPKTGRKKQFASGLPQMIPEVGVGGVMDVVFFGGAAYALVTLVDDPTFPTGQVNGIYRIIGANSFKVVADIGAFNLAHQPTGFPIDVATGVLYSFEAYQGGFIVTDGHFNRVLNVSLNGKITILKQFNNIVPTGLAIKGNDIFMSQAGPVPHLPENGKVVSFGKKSSAVKTIASGAPLIVDVEFGRGQSLFALSQGDYSGDPEGSPALPNTGSLVRVNHNGTFSKVTDNLDRPTSFEIIGNKAYIVTLEGEVLIVDNIAGPSFGRHH